jgi:protein-S-isoprenylcysteine O-methyltransferase Ste14
MHSDFAFRFVLLVLVIIDLSMPVYFRRKAAAATARPLGGHSCRFFMTERLLTIACYCGIVAYVLDPRLMVWSQVALPTGVHAVGAAVASLALIGLFWAFRHLGHNLLPDTPSANRALVTTGPYRKVRHPLYGAWVVLLTDVVPLPRRKDCMHGSAMLTETTLRGPAAFCRVCDVDRRMSCHYRRI